MNAPTPELSGRRPGAAAGAPGRKLAAENAYLAYIDHLQKLRSVVEFGCGLASWLRVARELGATEIHGYDSPEIPLSARGLGSADFSVADLAGFVATEKKYDLAICLEVAQRLSPRAGATLVKTLCSAADWVLFGAALPFQGGANHHNERWMEHWAGVFSDNGYLCYDILREMFWYNAEIPFYLRQNACLYVRRGADDAFASLGIVPTACPPSLIHPELYLKLLSWLSNRRNMLTDSRTFAADFRAYYQGAQMLAPAESASAPVKPGETP